MSWARSAQVSEVAKASGFSGVCAVDTGDTQAFELAAGLAHRAHRVPNTPLTRFAIASGSKAFTALTVMRLVEEGALALDSRVRDLIGPDAPPIADALTVEHLLTHTGGFTDYLDETDWRPEDYVLAVPPHTLTSASAYLPVLSGVVRQVGAPGEAFAYSNAGYVLLGIIVERNTGEPFHQVVAREVFRPAGLADTAFLRSDELPARAATGYLGVDGDRTNVLHLPVIGSGDGGAFTTAADVHRFWRALFDGAIVAPEAVRAMIAPRWEAPDEGLWCGMGFWCDLQRATVVLDGHDAGVSFWTSHHPASATTMTVLSNTSDGAWPVVGALFGTGD